MNEVVVDSFNEWRAEARRLLRANVAPGEIAWLSPEEAQSRLFASQPTQLTNKSASAAAVPRRFLQIVRLVSCHSDCAKWGLLYDALWRITHGERNLLKVSVDPTIGRLDNMRRQVGQDIHRMYSFVRFRRIEKGGSEVFVAWYRPDHKIVELAAPFFVDRFRAMTWSILTPDRCAHWDRAHLSFTSGTARESAPNDDELEDLWRTYYASTFNPARTNLRLMRAEMPARHWDTLPELDVLPEIIAEAPGRVDRMIAESRSCVPRNSRSTQHPRGK